MEAIEEVGELNDTDRSPRGPTFADVRKAYMSVRALDNAASTNAQGQPTPVIKLFNGNGRAKATAIRLSQELKPFAEGSEETLQDLLAQHCETEDGGHSREPKDWHEYRRAERAFLNQPIPELQDVVERFALRASVIGVKAVLNAPTDMLTDLGPFFIWDLTDEQMAAAEDGAANRSERRR